MSSNSSSDNVFQVFESRGLYSPKVAQKFAKIMLVYGKSLECRLKMINILERTPSTQLISCLLAGGIKSIFSWLKSSTFNKEWKLLIRIIRLLGKSNMIFEKLDKTLFCSILKRIYSNVDAPPEIKKVCCETFTILYDITESKSSKSPKLPNTTKHKSVQKPDGSNKSEILKGKRPFENGPQNFGENKNPKAKKFKDISACLQADLNAPKDLVTIPVLIPFGNQLDTIKTRSLPEPKNNEHNKKPLAEETTNASNNRNLITEFQQKTEKDILNFIQLPSLDRFGKIPRKTRKRNDAEQFKDQEKPFEDLSARLQEDVNDRKILRTTPVTISLDHEDGVTKPKDNAPQTIPWLLKKIDLPEGRFEDLSARRQKYLNTPKILRTTPVIIPLNHEDDITIQIGPWPKPKDDIPETMPWSMKKIDFPEGR